MKFNTFCRPFLLNETARFVQNGAVSCTVHTKKEEEEDRNGAVLNGTIIFFPWTCEIGEKDDFSSFLYHRPQSFQKDADTFKKTPTQPTFHVLKGRQHSGHPSHVSPLVFAYKNRGKGRKGLEKKRKRETENRTREEQRRGREEREQNERGQRRRKNKEAEEGEEEEGEAPPPLPPSAPQQHRRPPKTTGSATTPRKPFALLFWPSLLPSPCKTCTVRVCRRGEAGYCAHAQ